MTLQFKYNKLLLRVKRWADFTLPVADLEAMIKLDPYDTVIVEDVFQNGQRFADAHLALECRDLLREIGELGNESMI